MSPLQIETLIKVYAQPCEFLNPVGKRQLIDAELVEPDPRCPPDDGRVYHGYVVTKKGAAMMEALTSLPIPKPTTFWITKFEQAVDELDL